MRSGCSSMCRASERAITAALDMEYSPATTGISPAMDEVLTMCPPSPWRRSAGRKAWIPLPTPLMLTSITQFQSASLAAATGPVRPIPALLTSRSMRPCSASIRAAAAFMAARSVTSTARVATSRPRAANSSCVSARWSALRPVA